MMEESTKQPTFTNDVLPNFPFKLFRFIDKWVLIEEF